jgi:diguanylate cyclase
MDAETASIKHRSGLAINPAASWLVGGKYRRVGPLILIFLVACAAIIMGFGITAENSLRNLRDDFRERTASGEVVIVEIDAQSIAKLNQWPWPRSHYAKAIDRLTAANARSIAFDVDLSSESAPDQDQLLTESLKRAGGGVILPTFRQLARSGSNDLIDSVPAERFGAHAMLASVNIHPETDGVVRRYPLGTRTKGVPRPSIAAMLSESHGSINGHFVIDGAIDPATIPRISFIDLLENRVPSSEITGKRVLIGATAIELGDRYAFAGRGILPGVVVQALAAETLLRSEVPQNYGPLPALLIAMLSATVILRSHSNRQVAGRGLGALIIVLTLPLMVEFSFGHSLDVAPALIAVLSAIGVAMGSTLIKALVDSRMIDTDTGLGNLNNMVQAASRKSHHRLAAIRIDRFDEVSAMIGPERRAELLRRLAERITGTSSGAKVYRTQTSVLSWFVDDIGETELDNAFQGLGLVLNAPFHIADRKIDLRVHFGLATIEEDDVRAAATRAVLAADAAARGGLRWLMHSALMDDERDRRVAILSELDGALLRGEIWSAYQPKWSMADRRVTCVEALVRWSHPERGFIPPDHFIPVLEAEGRISDLTCYVLRSAIKDMADWKANGLDLGVAVNISAMLLHDKAFLTEASKILRTHRAVADHITLEVTESAAMTDPEAAITALERLRDLGVRISIDDYGTGQSTLTYLKRLPAAEIKIDKSFIQNLGESRSDDILVRSTIELAHELGLQVVAEGVETQEGLTLLEGLGCDYAQGWHVGKPVGAQALFEIFGTKASIAA